MTCHIFPKISHLQPNCANDGPLMSSGNEHTAGGQILAYTEDALYNNLSILSGAVYN